MDWNSRHVAGSAIIGTYEVRILLLADWRHHSSSPSTRVSFDSPFANTPGWHATIFPPYFVAGAIIPALPWCPSIPLRKATGLEVFITIATSTMPGMLPRLIVRLRPTPSKLHPSTAERAEAATFRCACSPAVRTFSGSHPFHVLIPQALWFAACAVMCSHLHSLDHHQHGLWLEPSSSSSPAWPKLHAVRGRSSATRFTGACSSTSPVSRCCPVHPFCR